MIDEKKLIEELHILRDVMNYGGAGEFQKGFVSGVDKAIQSVVEMDRIENDDTFKNFKLRSDSTLLSMTKQQLLDHIHVIYHNWSVENACRVHLYQIAKELSEKSIPKQVEKAPIDVCEETGYTCVCPVCGNFVGTMVYTGDINIRIDEDDYCPSCGQKLKWSD